jgi:N-acetylglucosaminyldiphosphoundecaprenol N-acetyl-beta-D-mannosaminyltransferase
MRTQFLDTPVDVLSLSETVELVDAAIRENRKLRQVSMNVAKLVKMRSDEELRQDVQNADIIGIDGMGIVFGMRLMGVDVPERVAGIDLLNRLLELCALKGYRPFFLGASEDVVVTASQRTLRQHPGIAFAGVHHGYFKRDEEAEIVADIERSGAHCLFLGMPTPAKERFLARYGTQLSTPFIMGVGGSFDVIAGHVKRAPSWVQRLGMEWAYRVYQEPRRMWKRYAVTNTQFAWLLGGQLLQRLWGRVVPRGAVKG